MAGGQDKLAWTACPPGVKITRVGGKITLDSLPPGGQAVQGGKINCYTGLAVELPIKFKFFTIWYGSKSLYFWEQKNKPFAHISLCIRAVTSQAFKFFKVGKVVFLLPHRSCILAPADLSL